MKISKSVLLGLFLVIFSQALTIFGSTQDEQKLKILNEIVSKIKDKKAHYYTAPMDLKGLGAESVPILLNRIDDPDSEVRNMILGAVVDFKKNDSSIIPLLIKKLKDEDYNVRITALNGLMGYQLNILKANKSDEMISNLLKMAEDRIEHSDSAILLLGNIGDTNVNKDLKLILVREKNNPNKIDNWYVLKPKIVEASSKVLFKLGDPEEIQVISNYLNNGTVEEKVLGIKCVEYAQRKNFASHIIPLLDDKNEVNNVAPSIPNLRIMKHVRDYAANALINLYGIKDIKSSDRKVFTSDEIIKLKARITR